MKKYKVIAAVALSAGVFTGCADTDIDAFVVDKPASIADYEYLNSYQSLKSYIDRSRHPKFLLGGALGAADYAQKGLVYRLANANFDIVTPGNAMKYASVVDDKGNMNFETVTSFVEAARGAGMQIYGHTLCWHEQQNVKYLNSLLKDRELPPVVVEGNCLYINASSKGSNPWDQQCTYDLVSPMEAGKTYVFTMNTRGSESFQFPFWVETPGAGNTHYGQPQITGGTTWGEMSMSFTVNSDCSRLLFCFGQFGGEMWFDDMKLVEKGTNVNLIANGDFEGTSLDGWGKPGWHNHQYKIVPKPGDGGQLVETEVRTYTYTDGDFPFYPMGVKPPVINGCIHYESDGNWNQFFILPGGDNPLTEGDYVVYLDLTANKDASGVQLTMQNGWGSDAQSITMPVPVSEGRHKVGIKMNEVAGGNYDIILKPQTADVTLDLRSVTICSVKNMSSIPLTPEEKAEVLTGALDRFIGGMMTATQGYVKAWDVVNEPISGGGNIQGIGYDLQHSNPENADNANKFYWQDYLGSDFVRVPVRLAREHFEAVGGNPEELKLFINDYNLESDWDDNQKLKSLINWIKRWESDGVTKIDGIGSQMHISYYLNPATQESKSRHIVKMLELLAASGKLVRITELDMGICDEDGKPIPTAEVTVEQHKLMADYYQFIIEKYFEIIPVDQQFGITQWCLTDSPENSGWRANTPTGLWNLNFNRKPAYAGFAEGLKK